MTNTPDTPYVRMEAGSLVIGNSRIERRVTAQPAQPGQTTSVILKQTGRDLARPGSREFSLSVDGRPLTSRDFVVSRAEVLHGDPAEGILHLATSSPPLAVELHFQAFSQHPVSRKWLVVENTGRETVRLSDFDWEDLNLLVDTSATSEVWVDYFTRREKTAVVTMDDCALLVNDPTAGEGFVLATEAPGPLKRLEAYARPGRIAAGYNRDDETVFERFLSPGEAFRSPASFLLLYADPIPQDVIDHEYASFVGEHLTACDVARVPSITVNTWVPHLKDIDRNLLLEQIDSAADLGVDAFQVDDGWYDRKGDWNADPVKFPKGLEEIADRARARGMRFGLWMTVANVEETSRVCREHPEWIARDRHGEPNRHPTPGAVTMCLDSGYHDFALEMIDGVVGRYQVDLLKLDFSVVRNLYAPGAFPGCFATNHGHRSPAESHVRIVERLFDLLRALRSRRPDCLIDLSYEAYGVMDGTDLGLTQVAHQNWFSNITSPNEISLRREIYQRGRVTRPWTLNYGGTVLNDPNAPRYGLFSALAGHAVFWGDLVDLDEETRATYRRWFAWVKAERARSDFYADYLVSDVFPAPAGLSSRDYRHAIPVARYGVRPIDIHPPAFEPLAEHPGETWDGVARLDGRGEGPIFLFRPAGCLSPYFQLHIPWVDPAAHYRLTDESQERELGVFPGTVLSEKGLEFNLPEPSTAKVIVLRRVSG